MEKTEKKIVLKKKKPSILDKLEKLFEDKKKRYLYTALLVLPLLILICVFGFVVYKDAKDLLSLANDDTTTQVDNSHIISSMDYVLRDNATEIQEEYFAQLKDAIEVTPTDDATIAGYICENFVLDFYTWTNKAGQYDVGGLYYVYNGRQEATGKFKELMYTQVRDTFYKYLNNYINTYGSENLLEVDSVNVVSCKKSDINYVINELTDVVGDENTGWTSVYEDVSCDTYLVTVSWTYKQNEVFDTSKYPTKMNFAVIVRNGRYEIVELSEGTINVEEFTY